MEPVNFNCTSKIVIRFKHEHARFVLENDEKMGRKGKWLSSIKKAFSLDSKDKKNKGSRPAGGTSAGMTSSSSQMVLQQTSPSSLRGISFGYSPYDLSFSAHSQSPGMVGDGGEQIDSLPLIDGGEQAGMTFILRSYVNSSLEVSIADFDPK
ncbi:beta-amylase 7-like protein [Corchorus capsularis]|uniref:Beta-amylase 7-like protein n=1 Tax=Corchorus capsularis TaxID=210143 RepID=A0A1R3HP37_COCAP|nr:beta-amylase 7-like protein [Corchorus capsularis]